LELGKADLARQKRRFSFFIITSIFTIKVPRRSCDQISLIHWPGKEKSKEPMRIVKILTESIWEKGETE